MRATHTRNSPFATLTRPTRGSGSTVASRAAAAQVGPLYPQLRGGHRSEDGPTTAQVVADQRARICGAMIEAVADGGYGELTVRRLCTLAGVSSATLYLLFPGGKEECFLQIHDGAVRAAARGVADAYFAPGTSAERLTRAFQAFARDLASKPKLARLVLVEALGVSPRAAQRSEHAQRVFETMIAVSLSDGAGEVPPVLVIKGIVAGIARVARLWVLEGRAGELASLDDVLLKWALCYCSPASKQLGSAGARRSFAAGALLPRVEGNARDARASILHATARLAALHGAGALTLADIAQAAGVLPRAFEEDLRDPQRCLLAAAELLSAEALAVTVHAAHAADSWAGGAQSGMHALARHVAGNDLFARIAFIEIFATGTAGVEVRERLLSNFAKTLWGRVPIERRPPRAVAQAAVGAAWGVIHHHVVSGTTRALPRVADQLSYLLLAPVLGAEQTVAAIRAEALAERGGAGAPAA